MQYKICKKCKLKNDPIFKLSSNIRNLIRLSFNRRNISKKSKTYQILGCDFEFLHNYLLGTFCINYGRMPTKEDNIHIDHIIPISLAETEEQVILLSHYTNLQWLLAEDNLKKADKLS